MIYEYFRATGAYEAVQGLADFFTVSSQNDDAQDFDVRWDHALLTVSEMPSDVFLEGLYKSKLQDSVLQTVLAHVMLNLKHPESSSVCDAPAERSKRPRDDSDPWNVAWSSDTHRRLVVLGDNKVVINWMSGAWEVKGDEQLFPCVVWWINLCGGSWVVLSGRELMRMIGVGISFVSRRKLRIHMLIG